MIGVDTMPTIGNNYKLVVPVMFSAEIDGFPLKGVVGSLGKDIPYWFNIIVEVLDEYISQVFYLAY